MDKGRIIQTKLKKLFQMTWPSQRKFAEASSVHPATVNEYFTKNKDLRISNFLNILEGLGIDLESVVDDAIQKSLGQKSTENEDRLLFYSELIHLLDSVEAEHRHELISQIVNLSKLNKSTKVRETVLKVEKFHLV